MLYVLSVSFILSNFSLFGTSEVIMKKVAIIYTVRPVLGTFPELLEEVVGEKLKIFNLLDDFLASDPGESGIFSVENHNRLFNDIKSCELTGADLIVVTCSTLTPAVQRIRPFIKVPIIAIDDAMMGTLMKGRMRCPPRAEDQGCGHCNEHHRPYCCQTAARGCASWCDSQYRC